ncbi:hypothetical protein KC726_03205 [Candidatus Woesebacteria bacterium]|nr:hypothetical protein [Candidatus Woesebacteria bacterium]
MNYFDEPQEILRVDENDSVLGSVDKLLAHKEGLLHRGFTLVLFHNDRVVLQHRKHMVFDDCFDTTISSHQLSIDDKPQNDLDAIAKTLERETSLTIDSCRAEPKHVGTFMYKASQKDGQFTEHEVLRVYVAKIDAVPVMNETFAYGLSLKTVEEIKQSRAEFKNMLAPWSQEMIKRDLLQQPPL